MSFWCKDCRKKKKYIEYLEERVHELKKERDEYDKRRRQSIDQATYYRDQLLELRK
jgi:hypothetical protein